MCGGASSTQEALQSEEAAFYQKQIDAYDKAYSQFSDISSALKAQFDPILARGYGQMGYTPGEEAALRTQATEQTATNYNQAAQALGEENATMGGGNIINQTGGPQEGMRERLATTAAGEQSKEQLGITTAGYDLGRSMWTQALQGEEALAAGWNPNAFSGSTVNAGNAAASEANTIAAQAMSPWTSVLGAVGGIAGQAAGGWANHGFKVG